jgi:hypothetical protein
MSSAAIATVTKMLESLPETAQDVVVDHLLSEAARHARQEIAEGKAQPIDDDRFG